jgi:hypothetical protein
MNYEEDLALDASMIDVDCLDQPAMVMKYARIAADSDLEMDSAKERLELVKAELDKEIRTHPEKFKVEKITEPVVANTILMQDEYKEAVAEYLQAKHEARIVKGATEAVNHRKTMLENLVKLHGQQYFPGPSIPHDLSTEWRKKQEQSTMILVSVLNLN